MIIIIYERLALRSYDTIHLGIDNQNDLLLTIACVSKSKGMPQARGNVGYLSKQNKKKAGRARTGTRGSALTLGRGGGFRGN